MSNFDTLVYMQEAERLQKENEKLRDKLADEEYVSKDLEQMFQSMRDEANELRAENGQLRALLEEAMEWVDRGESGWKDFVERIAAELQETE